MKTDESNFGRVLGSPYFPAYFSGTFVSRPTSGSSILTLLFLGCGQMPSNCVSGRFCCRQDPLRTINDFTRDENQLNFITQT